MTLAIVATVLWVLLLVALVVMVRRHPVVRHRCCWCGDIFYEPAECDVHESYCPGNPANHPRRVR